MRMGFISDEITSLLIIVALAIGVIIVGRKVLDLSRRNNIDYDKYNFPFNPKDVKDDTNRRVLSEATTRTLAQDSLLNVCKDIDKKKCLQYAEPFVPFQLKNRNYKISNPDDGSYPIPSSDTVYNCSAEYSEL